MFPNVLHDNQGNEPYARSESCEKGSTDIGNVEAGG